MIPDSAKQLIETWRLGFLASADADGHVNLSPKGTFVVLDDQTIAFAEMRSPNTVRNIADRPRIEVNFVDILSRKGTRLVGDARTVEKGSPEYETLLSWFMPFWPDLEHKFRMIVVINVSSCKAITSPAYDAGAKEEDLRQLWKAKIQDMPL